MAEGEAPPVVDGAKHAGSGIKDFLMKETAGMPNWAWVVIVVAGLGVAYILPRVMKGGASSASTDSTAPTTDGSGLGLALDPTTGLPYAVSGLVPVGGVAGASTDNLTSLEAQLNQILASQARDEASIQKLLQQKSQTPPAPPTLGGRLPGQGYKPPPGGRIPLARPQPLDPKWPGGTHRNGPTTAAMEQAIGSYARNMAGHGEGAVLAQAGEIASKPQPAPQPKHQQLTWKAPDWRQSLRNLGWWWL